MKRFPSFLSVGFAALAVGLIVWSAADARNRRSTSAISAPFISARLVDEKKNAALRAATVEVTIRGVRLVDPELVPRARGPIQGHLHYQLDGGAIIATPATELSFHELSQGEHKILVNLTDGNHIPIGLPVVLTLTIPAVKTVMAY
jgi:hypothetical protein